MQPTGLRAIRSQHAFEVQWPDGLLATLPFKGVRCACPCATCVDELTGRQLLDPTTVPEDILPEALEYSGNYAVKIRWSDGHSTGLYTWDRWRWLSEAVSQASPPGGRGN